MCVGCVGLGQKGIEAERETRPLAKKPDTPDTHHSEKFTQEENADG